MQSWPLQQPLFMSLVTRDQFLPLSEFLLKCFCDMFDYTLIHIIPTKPVCSVLASTSKKPDETERIDTSNVPPPKSYTKTYRSRSSLIPYASAAAVGSLISLTTLIPAISAASLMACR
jgi:hypothetical protein